jgi:peptidoglycan/LPS O-acetylase OafA/YrhL
MNSDVTPRPPDRHRWMVGFDLTLLGVTALLVVLLARDVQGLPRVLATVAFACLVPGGALVTRLPFRERDEILAMTLILSLSILAAANLVMAWVGAWHPLRLTAGLAAASGAVLLLDLVGHLTSTRAGDPRWPVS